MKIFTGKTVNEVYSKALHELTDCTGNIVGDTLEIENAVLEITKPSLLDMNFEKRKLSLDYAINEMKWYWSGSNSCHEIGQYAKKWLEISDDGETSNSAYGYIIFSKYGKNQLEEIIELLTKDKTSRRAVLSISDPAIDKINTKDMQCTIAIQFLLRDDELNMTVYMRSNDMRYGFPYDYIFFESIHEYIAERLNVKVGAYTHHATSLHLYIRDIPKMKDNTTRQSLNAKVIIDECYKI